MPKSPTLTTRAPAPKRARLRDTQGSTSPSSGNKKAQNPLTHGKGVPKSNGLDTKKVAPYQQTDGSPNRFARESIMDAKPTIAEKKGIGTEQEGLKEFKGSLKKIKNKGKSGLNSIVHRAPKHQDVILEVGVPIPKNPSGYTMKLFLENGNSEKKAIDQFLMHTPDANEFKTQLEEAYPGVKNDGKLYLHFVLADDITQLSNDNVTKFIHKNMNDVFQMVLPVWKIS